MVCDMKKVHEANLYMLKEIDRICRKYNIKYMLDAGTLIGAIRHQGFIPWDDDADVAFTRENYKKFAKVAPKELPEGLDLLFPNTVGGGNAFYDFTPRILYLNSQTHKKNAESAYYKEKINHLWVDLFIIDEISDNKLKKAITLFFMKIIYGFAMGHRYKLDYQKYSLISKLYVGILANIGKLIPMKVIYKWQERLAIKDNKGLNKNHYYSNYQPDYLYVTLDKKWCNNVIDLSFCDTKLMCPAGWDNVLKCVYGDYMKLPPEDSRIPSHSDDDLKVNL